MKNIFFEDEIITKNDLFFICYMVERVARRLHQRNRYVVDAIGYQNLAREISLAEVLHCKNPLDVEDDWIKDYQLETGDFYFDQIDRNLTERIPTATQMGKVYMRLIIQTLEEEEDYVQGMIRVYHSEITEIIDNYTTSAYYQPSYILKKAYYAGNFNAV